MSIRLRLTLIYSTMLALTLVSFSLLLYFSQARTTRQDFERKLAEKAQMVINDRQTPSMGAVPAPRPPAGAPPPRPPDIFYVQTRSMTGQIIEPDSLLGDNSPLPLSQPGLQMVNNGLPWVEAETVGRDRMLIFSQPVPQPGGSTEVVQVAGSMTSRDHDLDTLRNTLIVANLRTIGVTFGLVWLLAGLALRPIHRLTRTAQEIGASRDFGRRVKYDGPRDEVGRLALTFNDMLAELQTAYQQVAQSLQAQRRFVADASHELGTPLTTIRGNLELLQREPPIDAADRDRVLSDMVDETERLMRLNKELLTLARADVRRPLQRESILLQPLLEDLCGQFKLLAPQRTVTCHASPEATVRGDRDALKQVLLILLDNARKHTPADSPIDLTAAVTETQVSLSVTDHGPGISADISPHIFERFFRGDAARTGPGTGLGLAIARELTAALGGSIEVSSRVGQGAVFTLTFPH
jgi:signal transduction histidine kinase